MEQSARVDQVDRTDRVATWRAHLTGRRCWLDARRYLDDWRCLAALLGALLLSANVSFAQNGAVVDERPDAGHLVDSNIEIQHDHEAFVTRLKVHTNGGKLAYRDLLCALARARGYDDGELAELLPASGFAIDSQWAQASILAMNHLGKPYMTFAIDKQARSAEKTFVVALNRLVLLESKRRFKQRVKSLFTMAKIRKVRTRFGLQRPPQLSGATRQLVISIHGYNAFADDLDGLLAGVRAQGLACGRYSYPNDQAIEESVQMLASELKRLAEDFPKLEISLITHSMGGLVARRTIEDPALDPGNVRRLIMIAPPNHGSELAQFAFAMDLWELLGNRRRSHDLSFFYTSIEDGLAEAATDLSPDSIFLIKLNRANRNPHVDYTIILGNQAPLQHEDVQDLRDRIQSVGSKSRWIRFFGGKLDGMIEDLDELVQGHGDGVVSLQSGELEGVDDVVILPFSHTSVLERPKSEAARQVTKEITQRITE